MLPVPTIPAFMPPRRILMGPGPSDVYPEVLAAQSGRLLATLTHYLLA
jgi:alanine-glyoxylate transaminase/serine-glyoxylate transaminase/serine-pyruvate transaminase